MKMSRPGLFVCLLLLTAPAAAQSVNLDLGNPGDPAPGSRYRAAGMPGAWVKIDGLDSGFEYPLLGLDGRPVAATVDQIGGTEIQIGALGNPGDPAGQDAIFMADALITHTPIENCLFYDNLQQGTYEVLTYAWMPTLPEVLNAIRVDFNPNENLIGGAWPGGQTEGVTYARHFVEVGAGGFLGTHSGVPDGADFEIGAALNGVQIRKLSVEPPLFPERATLAWLASLDAVSYDVVQGDLAQLRAGGGNFAFATQSCLSNDTPSTSVAYGSDPAPGSGQWFLIRGVTPTGNATYESPGTSQVGTRDFEISLSGVDCL